MRSSAPAKPKSKSPFPEQTPIDAKGPIILFNGGVHGGTTLLFIHTYVDVPAPTAVIATVKITPSTGATTACTRSRRSRRSPAAPAR